MRRSMQARARLAHARRPRGLAAPAAAAGAAAVAAPAASAPADGEREPGSSASSASLRSPPVRNRWYRFIAAAGSGLAEQARKPKIVREFYNTISTRSQHDLNTISLPRSHSHRGTPSGRKCFATGVREMWPRPSPALPSPKSWVGTTSRTMDTPAPSRPWNQSVPPPSAGGYSPTQPAASPSPCHTQPRGREGPAPELLDAAHRPERPRAPLGRHLEERLGGRLLAAGFEDRRQAPRTARGKVQGKRARHGPRHGPRQPAAQRRAPPARGREADGDQRDQGGDTPQGNPRVARHLRRRAFHGVCRLQLCCIALHPCQLLVGGVGAEALRCRLLLRAPRGPLLLGLADALVGQRAAGALELLHPGGVAFEASPSCPPNARMPPERPKKQPVPEVCDVASPAEGARLRAYTSARGREALFRGRPQGVGPLQVLRGDCSTGPSATTASEPLHCCMHSRKQPGSHAVGPPEASPHHPNPPAKCSLEQGPADHKTRWTTTPGCAEHRWVQAARAQARSAGPCPSPPTGAATTTARRTRATTARTTRSSSCSRRRRAGGDADRDEDLAGRPGAHRKAPRARCAQKTFLAKMEQPAARVTRIGAGKQQPAPQAEPAAAMPQGEQLGAAGQRQVASSAAPGARMRKPVA
jgi:hypothetical protein